MTSLRIISFDQVKDANYYRPIINTLCTFCKERKGDGSKAYVVHNSNWNTICSHCISEKFKHLAIEPYSE